MDNSKITAQVSIEFAVAFVVLAIFVVATTKLFSWLGSTMVNRHKAYEASRSMNATTLNFSSGAGIPPIYFYNQTNSTNKLKIFDEE